MGQANLVNSNLGILGKWLWRFDLEQNTLSYSIIRSMFGLHGNCWDSKVVGRDTFFSPWKAFFQGFNVFRLSLSVSSGYG